MIPETHSLVLTTDYRVPDPTRVWPLLQRRRDGLAALGAHHEFVYTSTTDPERVLVTIALETREPVAELLRSRAFSNGSTPSVSRICPRCSRVNSSNGSISSPIRLQRRPASSSWASWSSTTLPCSGPVCAR